MRITYLDCDGCSQGFFLRWDWHHGPFPQRADAERDGVTGQFPDYFPTIDGVAEATGSRRDTGPVCPSPGWRASGHTRDRTFLTLGATWSHLARGQNPLASAHRPPPCDHVEVAKLMRTNTDAPPPRGRQLHGGSSMTHERHHEHGHGHQHDRSAHGFLRFARLLPLLWTSAVNREVVRSLAPAEGSAWWISGPAWARPRWKRRGAVRPSWRWTRCR